MNQTFLMVRDEKIFQMEISMKVNLKMDFGMGKEYYIKNFSTNMMENLRKEKWKDTVLNIFQMVTFIKVISKKISNMEKEKC